MPAKKKKTVRKPSRRSLKPPETAAKPPVPQEPPTPASAATPEMPIGFPDSVVAGGQERSTASVEPAATTADSKEAKHDFATEDPPPAEPAATTPPPTTLGQLTRIIPPETPYATPDGQPPAAEQHESVFAMAAKPLGAGLD